MKSLITGGAGFIGSHLAEKLLERGDEIYIIDNLWTGKPENISGIKSDKNVHLVIDTILNEPIINELIPNVDNIYHLAAAVGVKKVMYSPIETLEVNIKGTEIVLRLASIYKKKVLIASSSEVYGKHLNHILSENDNCIIGSVNKRRWAYSCSKTIDEFMALAYFEEKKLPVVIARLFNTAGPRQTGRYGMVLPNLVQRALSGESLPVFGDGTQSRCFCHVKDVVDALINLMNNKNAEGEIFNVGNNEEITIKDLAAKIKLMTGSKSEIEYIPYEKAYGSGFEDFERRRPDIQKLQSLIGYKPVYHLEDIILSVIDYFRECNT